MKKAYIFVKEKFANFEIETVLSTHFVSKGIEKKLDDDTYLSIINKKISKDVLLKTFRDETQQYGVRSKPSDVVDIYLVTRKQTRWYHGSYYAHEYDKYAEGRIRQNVYSNGYMEYEVECLDKSLHVLDGIWEEENHNGSGDMFEAYEPTRAFKNKIRKGVC